VQLLAWPRADELDRDVASRLLSGQPDFTYKRAGGQLLLLRVPGA